MFIASPWSPPTPSVGCSRVASATRHSAHGCAARRRPRPIDWILGKLGGPGPTLWPMTKRLEFLVSHPTSLNSWEMVLLTMFCFCWWLECSTNVTGNQQAAVNSSSYSQKFDGINKNKSWTKFEHRTRNPKGTFFTFHKPFFNCPWWSPCFVNLFFRFLTDSNSSKWSPCKITSITRPQSFWVKKQLPEHPKNMYRFFWSFLYICYCVYDIHSS